MPSAPAAVPEPASPFPFIGGRPCLNFVATLGKRHATPLERLPDPDALARWITDAGLSAGADDTPVHVTEGDLAHARTLREALYRLVRAAMAGEAPDPADVARANEAAARPDLAPQLAESQDDGATGSPCAGRPGIPDPRPSRPWPGTPSCWSAARSLPGSRSARTPSARCSSWTTPRPVGAAGAPWTAAATSRRWSSYRSRSRTGSSR
nr:ABATE domain-containing protein [Streptomyces sp. S1D4-11]